MAVEDELVQEVVRVFQELVQLMERFRGVSRGQQERMLRGALSDWLKNDPRADAVRKQIPDQTFEQRVTEVVKELLGKRKTK